MQGDTRRVVLMKKLSTLNERGGQTTEGRGMWKKKTKWKHKLLEKADASYTEHFVDMIASWWIENFLNKSLFYSFCWSSLLLVFLFFLLERKARHSCLIAKEQLLFLVPAFLSNYQAPYLLSFFCLSLSFPLLIIAIRRQTPASLVMRGYCHPLVTRSFSFWLSLSDFMRSCFVVDPSSVGRWHQWSLKILLGPLCCFSSFSFVF